MLDIFREHWVLFCFNFSLFCVDGQCFSALNSLLTDVVFKQPCDNSIYDVINDLFSIVDS